MQGLAMGVVKRFTDDEGYDDDSPDPVRVTWASVLSVVSELTSYHSLLVVRDCS